MQWLMDYLLFTIHVGRLKETRCDGRRRKTGGAINWTISKVLHENSFLVEFCLSTQTCRQRA
jgi:hypothetical protein